MSLHAVIFDLDGTLVDTESVWDAAMDELLHEKFHKRFDPSTKAPMMGKPTRECARIMKDMYGLDVDLEELVAWRDAYYHEARERLGVKPLPGADALLRSLHGAGVPLALATSERNPRAENTLVALGWRPYFSHVVVTSEVKSGKPAPDIYVEAARRLGCGVRDCVVFEDSPAGVESAKAAGMVVVGVPDQRYVKELPGADLIVPSLEKMDTENVRQLVS